LCIRKGISVTVEQSPCAFTLCFPSKILAIPYVCSFLVAQAGSLMDSHWVQLIQHCVKPYRQLSHNIDSSNALARFLKISFAVLLTGWRRQQHSFQQADRQVQCDSVRRLVEIDSLACHASLTFSQIFYQSTRIITIMVWFYHFIQFAAKLSWCDLQSDFFSLRKLKKNHHENLGFFATAYPMAIFMDSHGFPTWFPTRSHCIFYPWEYPMLMLLMFIGNHGIA